MPPDIKYTLDHTYDCKNPHNANKAFHLIQAFSPGEVSYEEAHQIGKELADRLLDGKYSYVLATHIDKGHVHNHLIFCSADNITFSHYHDCKKSYWKIRNLSDTLCQEHNLSTIMPDGKKGMKYNEWAANKTESSKKAQLRKDINQTIRIVSTYSEFLAFMEAQIILFSGAEHIFYNFHFFYFSRISTHFLLIISVLYKTYLIFPYNGYSTVFVFHNNE